MKSLDNKTAIVTGGGSGIGRAIALLYAAEGARIVVSDIDEKGANETVTQIKDKKSEALQNWFSEKISTFYIKVDEEYKSCSEMKKWLVPTLATGN